MLKFIPRNYNISSEFSEKKTNPLARFSFIQHYGEPPVGQVLKCLRVQCSNREENNIQHWSGRGAWNSVHKGGLNTKQHV